MMTFWQSINKPKTWAVTYIVLIPFFGALFWHHSNLFKIGNSKDTPQYQQYLGRFDNNVDQLLSSFLSSECGKCTVDSVAVSLVGHERSSVTGTFTAGYTADEGERLPLAGKVELQISAPADDYFEYFLVLTDLKSKLTSTTSGGKLQVTEHPLPDWLSTVGMAWGGGFSTGEASAYELLNMQDGILQDNNRHFGTFLYLSIVTITTLGYGDIIPLNGTARLLVGVEALTGVVLMGLFLNSLSGRVSPGKRSQTPASRKQVLRNRRVAMARRRARKRP